MPLDAYGLLKAQLIDHRVALPSQSHYHLHLQAGDRDYRAAINVRSKLWPSEVEYHVAENLRHPLLHELRQLPDGFHPIPRINDGLAFDFIRLNLFEPDDFLILPCDKPACRADLNEVFDELFLPAIADPTQRLYLYGEPWEAWHASDPVFRFAPSRGVHEIHMNQGNDPSHWEQDGTWQDGAILIEIPREHRWKGIFLKFQSQSWHTDDLTGHALSPPSHVDPTQPVPLDRHGRPHPDGMVRIQSIHLSRHDEEGHGLRPSVVLMNVCPFPISLEGWRLVNRSKGRWKLDGTLTAGESREFVLGRSLPLSSDGGLLTLLNQDGLKVHGISYNGDEA